MPAEKRAKWESVDSTLISDNTATVLGPINTASVGKKSTMAEIIKKCLSIESIENRHTASSMSSVLGQRVIKERVHALDEQLRSKQLTASDVVGDGYCLFRCLSVGEYGHKERRPALRTEITNHMLSEMAADFSSDGFEILK